MVYIDNLKPIHIYIKFFLNLIESENPWIKEILN